MPDVMGDVPKVAEVPAVEGEKAPDLRKSLDKLLEGAKAGGASRDNASYMQAAIEAGDALAATPGVVEIGKVSLKNPVALEEQLKAAGIRVTEEMKKALAEKDLAGLYLSLIDQESTNRKGGASPEGAALPVCMILRPGETTPSLFLTSMKSPAGEIARSFLTEKSAELSRLIPLDFAAKKEEPAAPTGGAAEGAG